MNAENFLPIDRAAINRENSLKSTGPKTDAGKQRSSLNALRHGLTGHVVVMPGDDLAAYQTFTARLHKDFQPSGEHETILVQSIADDYWRLNRAKAMEDNLYALALHEQADSVTDNPELHSALVIARSFRDNTKAIATLSLHQNRIARGIERNVEMLRKIQAERKEKEQKEMVIAGRLYLLHQAENSAFENPEPYNPAADGFVFTLAQIEAHVLRNRVTELSYEARNMS
jgi:hypothetical protein